MASSRLAMIHDSIGASRRVARIVGALSLPLLAIIAGSLPSPASAGSGGALGPQLQMRGSYCDESDQDLAPSRAGCARIKGYIAAGERSGSDDRIGGRPSPFGSLDEPGIVGARSSSGLVIIGAPLGSGRFLSPTSPGDIAR
jgi:hypothetical protein